MTRDDAMLSRIERLAGGLGVAATVVAWAVPQGGLRAAGAVAGGALLATISYWSIKRGVTGLTNAMIEGESARSETRGSLIILVGRYALLALIAYVMIARLRLSPIGLLAGASVIPAAVMVEAIVSLRKHG